MRDSKTILCLLTGAVIALATASCSDGSSGLSADGSIRDDSAVSSQIGVDGSIRDDAVADGSNPPDADDVDGVVARGEVTPEGGLVASEVGDVALTIPQGALDQSTTIEVRRETELDGLPETLIAGTVVEMALATNSGGQTVSASQPRALAFSNRSRASAAAPAACGGRRPSTRTQLGSI